MDPFLAQLARQNFLYFLPGALAILLENEKIDLRWYHYAIVHMLNEARAGRSPRNIVNMPPRTLKSTIISIAWTAWLLGVDPACRIMVLSYGKSLVEDLGVPTRKLMTSDFYRAIFPNTKLVQQTRTELRTDKGGYRMGIAMLGALTGRGADIIILDDPMNSSEVTSIRKRERRHKQFRTGVASRINDHRTGIIINLEQRMHPEDLSGLLLRMGGWKHLKAQAEAMHDATFAIGPGRVHHVKTGDLLDPVRLSPAILDQLKIDYGSDYPVMCLQEPVPESGVIIKREWILWYRAPIDLSGMEIVLTVDTALKGAPTSDYSVCLVWGRRGTSYYLLEIYRKKVDLPQLVVEIAELHRRYNAATILIEEQGTGSALAAYLRTEHQISSVAIKTLEDKATRLSRASLLFEKGQVFFPEEAPGVPELLSELFGFPNARHDDLVDATSQYLIWAHGREQKSEIQLHANNQPYVSQSPADDLQELLVALNQRYGRWWR